MKNFLSYLITDPKYYGTNVKDFEKKYILHVNKNKPDFALLRDKETKIYEQLAKVFVNQSNALHVKSFLHTDVDLALRLGAFGVHLPFCHVLHVKNAKENNLYTIVSTHTLEEALYAQEIGANAITFSPVFDTPNKAKAVGLEKLKEIIDKIQINCFALGGIVTSLHVQKVLHVNPFGFASIRYFI